MERLGTMHTADTAILDVGDAAHVGYPILRARSIARRGRIPQQCDDVFPEHGLMTRKDTGLPWLFTTASSPFGAGRVRRAHQGSSDRDDTFDMVLASTVVSFAGGSLIDRTS